MIRSFLGKDLSSFCPRERVEANSLIQSGVEPIGGWAEF